MGDIKSWSEKNHYCFIMAQGGLPLNPKHKYKVHITLLRIFPLGGCAISESDPPRRPREIYVASDPLQNGDFYDSFKIPYSYSCCAKYTVRLKALGAFEPPPN